MKRCLNSVHQKSAKQSEIRNYIQLWGSNHDSISFLMFNKQDISLKQLNQRLDNLLNHDKTILNYPNFDILHKEVEIIKEQIKKLSSY